MSDKLWQPPHLPIANAMGPLLSRKGRGDPAAGSI